MRKLWLAAIFLIAAAYIPAHAQVVQGRVVSACAGSSHTAGSTAPFEVLPDGTLCTSASFSGDAGGTAAADDADFTAGTTDGTPVMGSYQSSPTAVTDGDLGIIGIDANRNVKVTIEADNAGIGGGTQYSVGDAASATAVGTAALAVRDDALSTLSDADGDEVRLRVGADGALWTDTRQSGTWTVDLSAVDNAVLDDIADGIPVTNAGTFAAQIDAIVDGDTDSVFDDANDSIKVTIVSGAGSGGTALADDGDFTAGTTNMTPAGGFYQSSPTACTDGDACAIGIDANRNVKVSIEADNAGIGGGTQYDVGDAAGATATGTAALVVRDDALSTLADADGDEVRLRVDSTGQLWTQDAAAGTSLAIVDDWDESDRAKVNIITGQAGVTAGAGAVAGNTPRVTLASDDPAVASLATIEANQASTGTAGSPSTDVITVQGITSGTPVIVGDGSGALNVICDSGCSGSGGTSDVDDSAFTAASDSGNPIMGFVTTDDVDSGDVGVVAMTDDRALHVNIRADDGTEVTTWPVTGTVTANLSATDNAVLDDIADGIVVDLGANNDVTVTSGTITTVTTLTGTTTLTPGTGSTNLGKAEDAAHSSGHTGTMPLAVRNDAGTALAGTDADYIPLTTTSTGRLWVSGGGTTAAAVPATASQTAFRSDGGLAAGTAALTAPVVCQDSAVINATADNANTEIVALTASETIYVCGMTVIADAAASIQWIYGTGTACATGETDLSGDMSLAANGGHSSFAAFPIMKAAASNAFCIEITGTGNVGGWISYTKF